MEPFNAERIEAQVTDNRALSVALREIGRLARVVEEQSGRIESLEGANVKRDSETEPDAEPTYRIVEDGDGDMWGQVGSGKWACITHPSLTIHSWERLQRDYAPLTPISRDEVERMAHVFKDLANPQPFRNCTLTADDPEPPVGSVVLDRDGGAWQRLSLDWCLAGLDDTRGWNGLRKVGPPPSCTGVKPMSDIEDRVHAIECKVSELGVLTKRAMDAIQTLEDCQLVRLSPKQPEPALERYRMTRPTNIGAAVIDAGLFVWRLSSEARWRADEGMAWCQWADIAAPQPYQNCTLTADDPEPPIGSVVRHDGGIVSTRYPEGWLSCDGGMKFLWEQEANTPATLLYRGDA